MEKGPESLRESGAVSEARFRGLPRRLWAEGKKKDLEANYATGAIWYKDVQVAEWDKDGSKLTMMGAENQFAVAFRTLMSTKPA